MPVHFLFSLKNGDRPGGGHICFLIPHDNTVLAYISKMVQDIGSSYYYSLIGSHR